MGEWAYIERRIIRFYLTVLFLTGVLFLSFVLLNINLFENPRHWIIVFIILAFWCVFGIYEYLNTVNKILIMDSSIIIEWSSKRRSEYDPKNIRITRIGLGSKFLCVLDENWFFQRFKIPRFIAIDGFSADYKELILRVEQLIEKKL